MLFVLLASVMLTSCEKVDFSENGNRTEFQSTKKFTFHVKGDFQTDYVDMTRAAVRLEEDNTAGITDLWVLDYVDGELVQQVHQTSGDADFGHPSMALSYGHHEVKFIASKGDNPVLTATALTWAKVKDTFALNYPVDVAASSNGNRAPELKRVITGVQLVMTDAVPANAKSVTLTMQKSMGMAVPSLVAEDAQEAATVIELPASYVGRKDVALNVYSLCPTDEMLTDVLITVKANDNSVISEFTVADVALKKNRMTILKGEVFGRSNGFSVSISDTWDEPSEVEF